MQVFYTEYYYCDHLRRYPTYCAATARKYAQQWSETRMQHMQYVDIMTCSQILDSLAQKPFHEDNRQRLETVFATMQLDKSWKVEDLLSLWRNVVVGYDLVHSIVVVTTPTRSDIPIDIEKDAEHAHLINAFGQEGLLDVFSDEEEDTSNGQAYEEFLSLELRKDNA